MTIYFAGGETEAFVVSSSAQVAESTTTAASWDSAYARCSIRLSNGSAPSTSDYAETPTLSASLTTCWVHWEWYYNSTTGNSGSTMLTLYNSSATAVFRLQFTSAGVLQPQYWNGSAWTNLGSTFSISLAVKYTFDLKLVCGGSGSAEFYSGGILQVGVGGSASMTSVTNVQKVRWNNNTTNGSNANQSQISQCIVADVSTVGWKFHLKPPTGDSSTNTAFTGTFADVDETVLSTADFIQSSAANDVETFTGAALTLGSGTVKAVVVSGLAKNSATGPQNLQFALRRGSTNYFSSSVSGISNGYLPFQNIWETDPSTSSTWTTANAGSASTEFGVKSIT